MSTEKKTRTKKITEPITETVVIENTEPPSVTLDEVVSVEEILPEVVVIEEKPLVAVKEPPTEELTIEQSILNFLEEKPKVEIRINDYLKMLYKPPKYGEPPLWQSQTASKEIRNALSNLVRSGDLVVISDAHMKLSTTFYPDTSTMQSVQHNLNTVAIFVKKVN